MIGFTMLGSDDIGRAKIFYNALMLLFGASLKENWSTNTRIWYAGGPTAPMLAVTKPHNGKAATAGNGSMVALVVSSHDAVAEVHKKALELGGSDEGGPGFRSSDPGDLYRAYFRDLDGNKLMVFAAPTNSN